MLPSIFHSTTIRLTGWYMLFLMSLSAMFSFVIFQTATGEVNVQLERFQTSLQQQTNNFMPNQMMGVDYRETQLEDARENILIELLYVNLVVLVLGGFISYYLARRSLEPIEKAHEAQSRFTSDASHELRTPLAVMRTELEVILSDKNATSSEMREILESNLEEVNKLSKLAEMLLHLSHFDNKKLQTESVDLTKITNGIVKDFEKISKRIAVKSKGKLIVKANETAIAELIKILVDNALQYSPNSSIVSIKTYRRDDAAIFEITNAGAGINPDKMPFIFDRFYRADSSRTSGPKKGFGLGLALAKSIVEIHKGTLDVTSEIDGDTTFKFTLPIYKHSKIKSQS